MTLPLEIAGAIAEFNVGPLKVSRRGKPVINEYGGFDVAEAETVYIDPVATHPADPRRLSQMPEGDRTAEARQFCTTQRLYVGDAGQAPDVVEYEGRSFRIVTVEEHNLNGCVFISVGVLTHPNGKP